MLIGCGVLARERYVALMGASGADRRLTAVQALLTDLYGAPVAA